jgi:glyoxylase-like metal-dependent hydrolase (beta-lactamase superfamily II)
METYKIFPLLISRIYADIGTFNYANFSGEKRWYPIFSFLIQRHGRNVLVDIGCVAEEMAAVSALKAGYEDVKPLEEALKERGVAIGDIKEIILTHLHSDHCLNAKRLPQATFWIQEAELDFAMNPHPFFSRSFNQKRYEGVKFKTIKGDTPFSDGIDILYTPGHTAGTQSVQIQTDQGKVVIAGFCSIPENFNPPDKALEIIPPGYHLDLLQSYESVLRVKKLGAIIIPLHDPNLEGKKTIP